MAFNNEIEKVKAEIKMLEKKLSFLEELENHKSPVEEAYKDAYGKYPVKDVSEELTAKDNWNVISWDAFQMGYNAAYEEKVAQEPEENEWKSVALRFGEKLSGYLSDGYYNFTPEEWFDWVVNTYGKEQQIKNAVRESVKWCEEHPDKDPLDWVKPQTPEQVADGLKEAFREAVKQGVVSSTKSPTLYDVIADWWDDTFTKKETSLQELVDKIEEWLPKEQSAAGSQNVYVECTVEGFNDCLNTIKRKLR